jgi:hypothetical protein
VADTVIETARRALEEKPKNIVIVDADHFFIPMEERQCPTKLRQAEELF